MARRRCVTSSPRPNVQTAVAAVVTRHGARYIERLLSQGIPVREIASREGTAFVGGQSRANGSDVSGWSPPDADAGSTDRIAALVARWDAAALTGTHRKWSIAPVDSKRCSDADADCVRHRETRRAPIFISLLMQGPRVQPQRAEVARHGEATSVAPVQTTLASPSLIAVGKFASISALTPALTPVATPEAVADVVSEPVPRRWEIRTRYTLAQAFRSLSSCAAPFEHASQIADDLFAVSTHPDHTPSQRDALRDGAIVVDQLTGLAPQVFLMQSVCKSFRVIADLLEGTPVGAGDLLDLSMLNRHLMALRRVKTPLYAVREVLQKRTVLPKHRTIATARRADSASSGLRMAPRRSFGSAPLEDELDELALTSIQFSYRVEGEMPLQSRPDDAAASNIRYQPDGERADGDAPPLSAPRERPVRPLEVVESDVSQNTANHDDEAARTAIARIPDIAEAEGLAIREISEGIVPLDVQWAKVQSVPIYRGPSAAARWSTAPLLEYRVSDIDVAGRAPGERFNENGREYANIDGAAFAVRELLPGRLWIVDEHAPSTHRGARSARLHALPLRQEGGVWTLLTPSLVDVPDAHGVKPGTDGFIRYDGRKFVEMNSLRVEVSRSTIDGERDIARYAQHVSGVLPGADAMQIIRTPDGVHWLEGEFGYYRLRFDIDIHEFYIAEDGASGSAHQVLVDFDVQQRRWTALVPRREYPFSEMLSVGYIRREGLSGMASYRSAEGVLGERMPHAVDLAPASRPIGRETIFPLTVEGGAVDIVDGAEASRSSLAAGGADVAGQEDASGASTEFPRYTSDKTGVARESALFAHYATHLKKFPFFSGAKQTPNARLRRGLLRGVRAAFDGMAAMSMIAANRMAPELRHELTPLVLNLRQRLKGLYPDEQTWRKMTLPQKQREVSNMVRVAYDNDRTDMWPCLVGYCNEIADVTLNVVMAVKPKLRDHLLQIGLHDQRGIRATHGLLVYTDDPSALYVFGDLSRADVQSQRARPTLNEAAFYEWLLKNRHQALLIDAWATNKVLDFSGMETIDAVRDEVLSNVMEAGFDVGDAPRFKARAVLPERPSSSPRRGRRQVARALMSAPATWEVLAGWAATGDMPPEMSFAAVNADLMAAAGQASLDGARKALLHRLAMAFDSAGLNRTQALGIDRRMVTLAGRAAFALLGAADIDIEGDWNAAAAEDGSTVSAAGTSTIPVKGATVIDRVTQTDGAMSTDMVGLSGSATSTDASAGPTPEAARAPPLSAYHPEHLSGSNATAVIRSASATYLWMPDSVHYAVREIMPGRLFIVDPYARPFGRPLLPPIPLERDGALWRIVGSRH